MIGSLQGEWTPLVGAAWLLGIKKWCQFDPNVKNGMDIYCNQFRFDNLKLIFSAHITLAKSFSDSLISSMHH